MRKNNFLIILSLIFLFIVSINLYSDSSISGDTQINKCETHTYTITLQNTSTDPITNIVVHNTMPATGFSYLSGTSSITSSSCSSTSNPSISGNELIWDIDSICGSSITLNPGDSLTIQFDMETDCNAVSGSDNVHVEYDIGGSPSSDDTAISIDILPGALTITKTPAVVSAALGDTVTWTIKVENTGLGKVKNVVITDTLNSGLSYSSSSPAGTVNGQTITWDSSIISALSEMNPGDYVEITIDATVVACDNLDNNADVKWGCDDSNTCFDTTTDGGTATASIQFIVKSPNLDFTPPDVNFNYCEDTQTVSFQITNIGDGTAHNPKLCVDFGPLTVTSVTSPATYSSGCFNLPDLGPSDTFTLEYTLGFSDWCSKPLPSGELLWQPQYYDDCNNLFYPTIRISSYNTSSSTPSLSVTKSGPSEVQIGSQINYHITVDYSGPTSCGTGSTSQVTVIDNVPDGFTVVNPDGGTWTPGTGGTGGTIVWTFDPSVTTSITKDITLQVPDTSQCETYCFTTFSNDVTASATDCCGCDISASASQTTAIECEQLVDSNKTASPSIAEKCTDVSYTNTYDFTDSSALDSVDLSQMSFEEHAENNQQYVSGTLHVIFDGSDITGCVNITDNTPGGSLILDFSNCTGYGSVKNKNLTITYNLRITDSSQPSPACGGTHTFYSWSSLDTGISGGDCLQDGVINETTQVSVEPPSMSLTFSGLPTVVDKCKQYDIDLTIDRNSTNATPYDVIVRLNTDNYYIVTVTGYDGVNPVSGPVNNGTYYEWNYGDNFSSGNQGIIHLTVQKRCEGGAPITANVFYDDNCHNDSTADEICSDSTTFTPPILLSGDIIIKKTPEVYYAKENTSEWKIYVTNKGNGTAYDVWVDDVLGAGLTYSSASVDNMTGVTITANQDHLGNTINGATILISEMAPGERREITFDANIIDCNNLTNDVSSSWGCVGVNCENPVSDTSSVIIQTPLLVNTNYLPTPINSCSTETGTITLKNAGATDLYNLEITETLPSGLNYVSGTTQWRINGGVWNSGADPNPATSPIKWTQTELPVLASFSPGDTIEIRYDVKSDCDFSGGEAVVQTQYEDPCGDIYTSSQSSYTIALNEPDVSITKTRITPSSGPLDCNQNVTWQISVTNNSGYTLPVIYVEDTLGAAFTYVSSQGDSTYGPADNGYNSGQNVYWEIQNLPSGATANLRLTATTDSSPCSHDLDNSVIAYWGCGSVDGDSSTNPNTEGSCCLSNTGISDTNSSTREPDIDMSVSVSPTQISSCSGSANFTVTLQNNGTTEASSTDLIINLPAGLTYVANSSTITCPGGAISNVEPTVSGNQLIYYDISDKTNNMCDSIPGGDSATIKFSVQSSCYLTSNMDFTLYYYDCCDDQQYNSTASQQITALTPQLSITKTPSQTDLDCSDPSDTVTWTISVTNNGSGDAGWVRIEDILGDSLVHDSGGTQIGGDSQRWGWEFGPLNSGASQSFQITAHATQPANCSTSHTQNRVQAVWGCGSYDGNPNTTAEYDCENSTVVSDTAQVNTPNLQIESSSTPVFTCSSDGSNTTNINVRIRNDGDAAITKDFKIRISDNHGNSREGYFNTDFGGTLPLSANTVQTIQINSWSLQCSTCDSIFTMEVDTDNDICECNESDNTTTISYHTPSYNLKVNSITPSCSGDGQSLVQVQIENDGCNDASSFTVHLEDNQGNSRDITVTNLLAGSTTTINFANWTTLCSPSNVIFTATADYNNDICECEGADNSLTYNYSNTSSDLVITSITPNTSCTNDGNISGIIQIQINNQGNGPVTNDFRIQVSDGQGWSSEQSFTSLGGTLPLNAGDSQTITINWTRNFTSTPYTCNFNITATVDSQNNICECSNVNNTISTTYNLPIPDLNIQSMSASCVSDGKLQLDLVVSNEGCSDLNSDFNIKVTDNKGNTETHSFTSLGGTLPFQTGTSQTISVSDWDYDCSSSNIDFNIELDSDNQICELSLSNNTLNWTYNLDEPDLQIGDITYDCNLDGSINFTIPVSNNGYGNASGAVFSVYDDTSAQIYTQNMDLNSGDSTTINFTTGPYSGDINHNFRFIIDESNNNCECNGDNEKTISANCHTLGLTTQKTSSKQSVNSCDELEFTLKVTNVARLNAYSLKITDTLPQGFSYIRGSTIAQWPGGTYNSDPIISGNTLTWNIGAQLNGGEPVGEELILRYKVNVGTCANGTNEVINVFKVEGEDGSGTKIPAQGGDPDDNDPDDSSSVIINLLCPQLEVERVCPEKTFLTLKDTLDYTLIITNSGAENSILSSIIVNDVIPEGWSLISYSWEGISPNQGPSSGQTGNLEWKYGDYKLKAGESIKLNIKLKPNSQACGIDFKDNLTVSALDNCGEVNYTAEANQCNAKLICGKPYIEIKKLCPRAQQPGGIYNFELEITNSGDGKAEDVKVEDILPDHFQYVKDSSLINDKKVSEPEITGQRIVWNLGILEKGKSLILKYSAIAPSDTDPGRYCNKAKVFGVNPDGTEFSSNEVSCCTVLRREKAGCCLYIEEKGWGSTHLPYGYYSLVTPYFKTEDSMFASYSGLILWNSGKYYDKRMAERLKNYSIFNIENLYFKSDFGLKDKNGILWQPYGGAYVEKSSKGWKKEKLDKRVYLSQIGFELLGLNEYLKEIKDNNKKEKVNKIINNKIKWLSGIKDYFPNNWEIEKDRIKTSKAKATRFQKAVLFYALTKLNKTENKDFNKVFEKLKKSIKVNKFDKESPEAELFLILALNQSKEIELAKKKLKKFEKYYKKGKIRIKNLETFALAYYAEEELNGNLKEEIIKKIRNDYISKIGLIAPETSRFNYSIRLRDIAALYLGSEKEKSGIFFKSAFKSIDEAGLFFRKRYSWIREYPVITIFNYLNFPNISPIIAVVNSTTNIPAVFLEKAKISLPENLKSETVKMPEKFTSVVSSGYETKTDEILRNAIFMHYLGENLIKRDDVYSETGKRFLYIGKSYIKSLQKFSPGYIKNKNLLIPEELIGIKGKLRINERLESFKNSYKYDTKTIADYLLAQKLYLNKTESFEFYNDLMNNFEKTGYIPQNIFISPDNGKIIYSDSKAEKITIAKFYLIFKNKFLEESLSESKTKLSPQDILFIYNNRELVKYFKKDIENFLNLKHSTLKSDSAKILASELLGKNPENIMKKLKDYYKEELGIPVAMVERKRGGLIYHTDLTDMFIYLTALKSGEIYERNLDFVDNYLISNWEIKKGNTSLLKLPPQDIIIIKRGQKQFVEPGDLLTFRVTTKNICPVSYSRANDLPQLLIKAKFNPELIYYGSEEKEQLTVLDKFLWKYSYLNEGEILDYQYQALIPYDFKEGVINGEIFAKGYTGYNDFFPDESSGERCDAYYKIKGIRFVPDKIVKVYVFLDENGDGKKENNEKGIPMVRLRDSEGRIHTTNTEGVAYVKVGEKPLLLQIDINSLEKNLIPITKISRIITKDDKFIIFGLTPVVNVYGKVYEDKNLNNKYDEGEKPISGIVLKVKDKLSISNEKGIFEFKLLPKKWIQWIRFDKKQPFYKGLLKNIKFKIWRKK